MLRGENLCNSFGFLCCRELSALSWTISKSGLGYILTQFVFHFCCSLTFLFPALRIHNLQNKIFYYGKIKYLIKDIKIKLSYVSYMYIPVLHFINFEMKNIYQITGHLHINSLENLLQLHVSIQNQYPDKYFIPLTLSFYLLKCSYFMSMFFPMQFLIVIHLYISFELK